jgi:hypothetical protein
MQRLVGSTLAGIVGCRVGGDQWSWRCFHREHLRSVASGVSDASRRSPKLVSPGASPHNTPEHAYKVSVRLSGQSTPTRETVAKFTFGDAGGGTGP